MSDAAREFSRRGLLGGDLLRFLREEMLEPRAREALAPKRDAGPGIARILPTACIALRGTLCVTCVERCPIPGTVRLERGRPVIDAAKCDGCGECIEACPAPRKAIVRVTGSA